jgi:copper(I)-binding protein
MRRRTLYLYLLALGMFVLLTGCGTTAPAPDGGAITVEQAWARPSPKMAAAGAAYMIINNSGGEADKLTSASTDAAEVIELHESFMDDNDVMKMRPVEGGVIEIPAGGSVALEPGGLHVMMINLESPLEEGNAITLNLQFEKAGDISIQVPVSQQPPAN